MSHSLNRFLPLSVDDHADLFRFVHDNSLGDETDALELKSEWDLMDKKKTGNLAKLILGFANRDPAVAAKYFGGEAYLVLGVDAGRAKGVTKADAASLVMQIQSYTGTRGPQIVLDYGRFTELDVAVITMLPVPRAAHIYALEKGYTDYSGRKEQLWQNGTIFVRSGTSTEVATAEDIRRLERRLIGGLQKLAPEVDVSWQGDPKLFWYDESSTEDWLKEHRERLLAQQRPEEPVSPGPLDFGRAEFLKILETAGKQTTAKYKKDLNAYIAECRGTVHEWLYDFSYSRVSGSQNVLRVTNTTDEAMIAVRLTLQFREGVEVVTDELEIEWPKPPTSVGRDLPSNRFSEFISPRPRITSSMLASPSGSFRDFLIFGRFAVYWRGFRGIT